MDKRKVTLVLLTIISSYTFSQSKNEASATPKPLGDEAFTAIQEFFKYDKSVSIYARVIETRDKETYKLEKFVFTNTKGKLVIGYLAIPKSGRTNFPTMILLHAGAGAKEDWWTEDSFVRGLSFVNNLYHLELLLWHWTQRLMAKELLTAILFQYQKFGLKKS